MSTSPSASPNKRARSPNSELSPMPNPKSQTTPSQRDRASKALSVPPVGSFSTKSPAAASRSSAPRASPLKQPTTQSERTSTRLVTPGGADQKQSGMLRTVIGPHETSRRGEQLLPAFQGSPSATTPFSASTTATSASMSPLTTAIQTSTHLAIAASTVTPSVPPLDVSGAKEGNEVKDRDQDGKSELSLAVLLETMIGTGKGPSIIGSITAAQSSLAQLSSTYQRVLTTPINPKDCDRIIKALEALKQGGNTKLATTKASLPQSPRKPSTLPQSNSAITLSPQFKQEIHLTIKAAHDQGFKAGVSTAREALATEVGTRIQQAHDQGFKAGVAAATERHKEASGANQDVRQLDIESIQQFEKCKEWLRDMVRARDQGEKARIGLLISKAEMAEWLEHKRSDGLEVDKGAE